MKRLVAIVLLILNSVPALAQSETPITTIVLGGPRKVVAEITQDADDLSIAIKMLSVRSFDKATNLRISRDKAVQYAHAALARHLFPKQNNRVTFTLSGATVEKPTLDGKHFRLTFRVPLKGVSQKEVAETTDKIKRDSGSSPVEEASLIKAKEKRPATINLFEVKGDYAETERLLSDSLKTAIPTLAEKAGDDQRKVFFRAIADLEEQADQSFDVLVAEMRQNKLLLSIEADELTRQVEKDRTELMDLLKKTVATAIPAPLTK